MKRIAELILCASLVAVPMQTVKAENVSARQVEYLGRGGYGVAVANGIYLSWRLLGTEPVDQTFDIYRNNTLIQSDVDATNYTDKEGTVSDTYKIIPHNGTGPENDVFKPRASNYLDILLDKPEGGDGYSYEMRDASVGDVDNDGEYELIIKWDPSNKKDNSEDGYTGNVYLDCYKQNGKKLWRIDMGRNVRAGDHYTQFIVYDFDGDGKAEMAVRTAPGSKDSTGAYVSAKGAAIAGEELAWKDANTGEVFTDESDMCGTSGHTLGKIYKGPDWLTMFNGETGEAIQTVNYYPQRGKMSSWGDEIANRSERFLGGVAYLDGVHPSLVMSRGYYMRAAMAAYDWDGKKFSIRWTRDDTLKNKNLYGNGNHSLSVCDADNDGKDEIVFGSTVVDDNGEILNSTDHGHGDALHVSDFNNDGEQEIFSVHEEQAYYREFGAEVRKAKDGTILGKVGASGDVGRGLMGNFDDDINSESEFFSSANTDVYNMSAAKLGSAPANINPSFLIWWDGDLSREILNRTSIFKYDIGQSKRTDIESFSQVVYVGKDRPLLSADLFGDWREEICYPTEDNSTLRIFVTTDRTEYKIPTLMHDTQYRAAIAWQNVGYNQPPHPKFYVGKAALDSNGRYLAPATGFDTVTMVGDAPVFAEPVETEKPEDTYTVNIKAVGDITRTISTYDNLKYGDSLSYAFPKYIVSGTTAYEATANSSGTYYGGSIANVVKDQDIAITYTEKYSNVAYFEDLDVDTKNGADVRASNCMAQDNKAYTSEYKLQPGYAYTIVIRCNNRGRGSQLMADGKTLLTISKNNNTWEDYTIEGVTVNKESALYTVAGGSNTYDPLDTVLIIKEQTKKIDLTALDGTGISITGASSVTAGGIVLPGVKSDDGSKKPAGYITYTAQANGKLTLTFKGSAIKNNSNKPRIYYCTDFAKANKNNAVMFTNGDVTEANTPITVSLDVKKGTTYYLFGYLYNMTSDFTYTISDISVPVEEKAEPVFTVTKLLESFGEGTKDGSSADAYDVLLEPNGNTIISVDVTVNNKTKSLNSPTITDGVISFGVIIGYAKNTSERYEPIFKANVD